MAALRVLELYSGMGGMHCALLESGLQAEVVAAVDINTTANQIYRHNFPDTPLWNKTIEGIPLDDFDKLSADMILMSPPCQPFTRLGRQGDVADPRTRSLLFILDLLPRLSKRPAYILLENVKGFEGSSARDCLIKTLTGCGYSFQEFMISPTSVGIPNSRLRYFLVAKLSAGNPGNQTTAKGCEFPTLSSECPSTGQPSGDGGGGGADVLYKRETPAEAQRKTDQNRNPALRQIQDFLEPRVNVDVERCLLKPQTLLRYGSILDIVQPQSRRSVCFTKGYGRYVEGTGSVLQCCMEHEVSSVFTDLEQLSEEEKLQKLLKLELRYFTPREVANLMGFPPSFSFPEDVSISQQYKVLGNSLNVVVVAKLLQETFNENPTHSEDEQSV